MTVRVATILSSRDWEPNLVAHARDSVAVRIVVRAFQPRDIEDRIEGIDVVVAGGEISWVTPAHIRAWKASGLGVLGVVPAGDAPARDLLLAGGSDDVVPDTIDIGALVQAIRFVAPESSVARSDTAGTVIGVLGARGAPGSTEVAISFALATAERRSTVLIDADVEAPSVAIRLGLPPRPDITDAADEVRQDGSVPLGAVHSVGSLAVIVGSHRPGEALFRDIHLESVIRAARNRWRTVIVDIGASRMASSVVGDLDDAILVVDASALGIVRAARLADGWMGPAPALVLNRVTPSNRAQSVEAVRRWTGLDPAVIVHDRPAVRKASCSARLPERRFAQAVGRLRDES
ncbi:MAG TPA: hypothetical protein VLA29_12715 [Acidimicrobiia bacterium]|nr:hypothetical protein [Acidimicrobiia bacterium]